MVRSLDLQEIKKILPHRYPFLLVDRILELDIEAKKVVGLKNVTANEPFFQGHFPDDPVMPGVLVVEAMGQVGGVLACLATPDYDFSHPFYFMGMDKVRFRQPVRPGDTLIMKAESLRSGAKVWKLAAEAFVDDRLVASAHLFASIYDPAKEGG
ncbi:MAG: 3-hydroxyacyl-ACP dehydratase FabZ [Deltaproteobacteria bacterium]|nr:3-hydroxyacyl-ACP dehydratase FabZ [Deltaproteobacteria bacterium]